MDEKLIIEFYSLIGEAVWQLQNLEEALNVLILVKNDLKVINKFTKDESDEILNKYKLNTFGSSIKIAEKNCLISNEFLNKLKTLNNERNWLIHKLVYKNRQDVYHSASRIKLFSRIKSFSLDIRKLHNLLGKEIENYAISVGVDPAYIEVESKRILSNLRNNTFI